MLLVTAATAMEIAPLQEKFAGCPDIGFLITGIGLVDTAHSLTSYLEQNNGDIAGVINIGVAGAFPGGSIKILDLCLASSEVIGDLAICFEDHLAPLGSPELILHQFFPCQGGLLDQFQQWCVATGQAIHLGPFVSVNSVSATKKRGEMLAATYKAVSENMEGAAIARVCQSYDVDWLEIRCMSNMVEDRDTSTWLLAEAIEKCSDLTAKFLTHYIR
ncbi:MAG: futalosine hydrolase [Thermodesulfobacteriota bacterium]